MLPSLSILLPVYNWPVGPLVAALAAQCAAEPGLTWEIRCLDDGSSAETRATNCAALAGIPGVTYEELPANIGRAAIRNRLAAAAKHDWLLLLDNDSGLPDAQFIRRYREAVAAEPAVSVWVGGTAYEAAPPADVARHLRWAYGRAREQRPAVVRNRAPQAAFTLNNLLIRAATYRAFGLDERLGRTYGHEDTAMGGALAAAGIRIGHLDNPVWHLGLEPADVFLTKTREALSNLAQLAAAGTPGLVESGLWQAAQTLRRRGLAGAFRAVVGPLEPRLLRHLRGARPSVRAFDLWRLLVLLRGG